MSRRHDQITKITLTCDVRSNPTWKRHGSSTIYAPLSSNPLSRKKTYVMEQHPPSFFSNQILITMESIKICRYPQDDDRHRFNSLGLLSNFAEASLRMMSARWRKWRNPHPQKRIQISPSPCLIWLRCTHHNDFVHHPHQSEYCKCSTCRMASNNWTITSDISNRN